MTLGTWLALAILAAALWTPIGLYLGGRNAV
jgi:hypothetical protein